MKCFASLIMARWITSSKLSEAHLRTAACLAARHSVLAEFGPGNVRTWVHFLDATRPFRLASSSAGTIACAMSAEYSYQLRVVCDHLLLLEFFSALLGVRARRLVHADSSDCGLQICQSRSEPSALSGLTCFEHHAVRPSVLRHMLWPALPGR
mmetsp:Transcript_7403/g.17882  ORF Transcript_7403/g.17882 Transcript_7403/m.17882 type:complete len:153 (-) Transcript_7403:125-583(-)